MIFRFSGREAKRRRPTIAMLQTTLTPAIAPGASYRPFLRRRQILGLSPIRGERPRNEILKILLILSKKMKAKKSSFGMLNPIMETCLNFLSNRSFPSCRTGKWHGKSLRQSAKILESRKPVTYEAEQCP